MGLLDVRVVEARDILVPTPITNDNSLNAQEGFLFQAFVQIDELIFATHQTHPENGPSDGGHTRWEDVFQFNNIKADDVNNTQGGAAGGVGSTVSQLLVQVHDVNFDVLLGVALVPLHDLPMGHVIDAWYPLENAETPRAAIRLRLLAHDFGVQLEQKIPLVEVQPVSPGTLAGQTWGSTMFFSSEPQQQPQQQQQLPTKLVSTITTPQASNVFHPPDPPQQQHFQQQQPLMQQQYQQIPQLQQQPVQQAVVVQQAAAPPPPPPVNNTTVSIPIAAVNQGPTIAAAAAADQGYQYSPITTYAEPVHPIPSPLLDRNLMQQYNNIQNMNTNLNIDGSSTKMKPLFLKTNTDNREKNVLFSPENLSGQSSPSVSGPTSPRQLVGGGNGNTNTVAVEYQKIQQMPDHFLPTDGGNQQQQNNNNITYIFENPLEKQSGPSSPDSHVENPLEKQSGPSSPDSHVENPLEKQSGPSSPDSHVDFHMLNQLRQHLAQNSNPGEVTVLNPGERSEVEVHDILEVQPDEMNPERNDIIVVRRPIIVKQVTKKQAAKSRSRSPAGRSGSDDDGDGEEERGVDRSASLGARAYYNPNLMSPVLDDDDTTNNREDYVPEMSDHHYQQQMFGGLGSSRGGSIDPRTVTFVDDKLAASQSRSQSRMGANHNNHQDMYSHVYTPVASPQLGNDYVPVGRRTTMQLNVKLELEEKRFREAQRQFDAEQLAAAAEAVELSADEASGVDDDDEGEGLATTTTKKKVKLFKTTPTWKESDFAPLEQPPPYPDGTPRVPCARTWCGYTAHFNKARFGGYCDNHCRRKAGSYGYQCERIPHGKPMPACLNAEKGCPFQAHRTQGQGYCGHFCRRLGPGYYSDQCNQRPVGLAVDQPGHWMVEEMRKLEETEGQISDRQLESAGGSLALAKGQKLLQRDDEDALQLAQLWQKAKFGKKLSKKTADQIEGLQRMMMVRQKRLAVILDASAVADDPVTAAAAAASSTNKEEKPGQEDGEKEVQEDILHVRDQRRLAAFAERLRRRRIAAIKRMGYPLVLCDPADPAAAVPSTASSSKTNNKTEDEVTAIAAADKAAVALEKTKKKIGGEHERYPNEMFVPPATVHFLTTYMRHFIKKDLASNIAPPKPSTLKQRGRFFSVSSTSAASLSVWQELRDRLPTRRDSMYDLRKRQKLFRAMDGNGSGRLSLAEIDSGCQYLPQLELGRFTDDLKPILMRAFTAARMKSGKLALDPSQSSHASDRVSNLAALEFDPNAYVDFREFRILLVYIKVYYELWFMFDAVDRSDDRRVSREEFHAAIPTLNTFGVNIHPDDTDAIDAEFDSIDTNHGGMILFREFADWAIRTQLDADGEELNSEDKPPSASAAVEASASAASASATSASASASAAASASASASADQRKMRSSSSSSSSLGASSDQQQRQHPMPSSSSVEPNSDLIVESIRA